MARESLLPVLLEQDRLPLLRGELALEDCVLIIARVRDTEAGSLSVKPIGRERIACGAESVELAPRENLDGAGIVRCREVLQRLDVLGTGRLRPHPGDDLREFGLAGLWRRLRLRGRRRRTVAKILLAFGIGRLETAIGPVEIVELRVRGKHERHCRGKQQESDAMRHRGNDSRIRRGRALRLAGALSSVLLVAACGWSPRNLVASITGPVPAPSPVDDEAGIHGALIGADKYSVPLTPAQADAAIAPGLRSRLERPERQALAEASQQAATAKRGARIAWPPPPPPPPPAPAQGQAPTAAPPPAPAQAQTPAPAPVPAPTPITVQAPAPEAPPPISGFVVAVSDVYLSSHGLICRDLRQALVHGEEPTIAAVSLCREDASGGAHVWIAAHWP